jgi:signal transduction histidine kinase
MHIASIRDSYRELSQRNKELQESYQKLKELDQMKSNFLATVSHELRTPLTSIIGYSEMLLEGLAGELKRDQQDFIKTIMEKGEHLLGLITSLLEISKMEIGQVTLERKDTNITELCKDAILTIKPEAVKRGLKLEMNLEKEMPSVSLDKDRMRQVLLNLLSNALKFTPKGGSILLEAKISEVQSERKDPVGLVLSSPTRKILELAVHDTGIGIPPDKLSQIFEPFFQVDGTSTRKYEGTGLGLSIVKRIVEAHNGEIKVKSTLNQGSSFFVTIPLEQEQE